MTYNPRTYWTDRALREGPDYVATHGDRDRWEAQYRAFSKALRWALSDHRLGWLVDFGCGSGRFAPVLAPLCQRYFGMDLSPVGIAQAQASHPESEFWWLSEDRIPLDDGKVSAVVAITVFQHIVDDLDWVLWASEIRRVLKPDGRVVVIDAAYTERDDLAPHMKLRRPVCFAAELGIPLWKELGTVEGHWVGIFKRGDE